MQLQEKELRRLIRESIEEIMTMISEDDLEEAAPAPYEIVNFTRKLKDIHSDSTASKTAWIESERLIKKDKK